MKSKAESKILLNDDNREGEGVVFMTWRQSIEEELKSPGIGTDEWFQCIPGWQVAEARKLVTAKIPVSVQSHSGSASPAYLVLFDGTEFLAGGFDERSAAEIFAASWNTRAGRVMH